MTTIRLPESVTSGFVLWGVVLGGHYHQSVGEASLFLLAGVVWLSFMEVLRAVRAEYAAYKIKRR